MKERQAPGGGSDSLDSEWPSVQLLLELGADQAGRKDSYRPGELLREFRITRQVLRGYESNGFIKPSARGTKLSYSSRDRARLRCALLAEALGFPLAEAMQIAEHYTGPAS